MNACTEVIDLPTQILEELEELWGLPDAVRMKGPNPIAPSCPQAGIFSVSQWACTTKSMAWVSGTAPEGWDALVREEEAALLTDPNERVEFIVIWDRPPQGVPTKGFCIRLADTDCYTGLHSPPSKHRIEDLAEHYADLIDNR